MSFQDFSSDYILEQYRLLNEMDWFGDGEDEGEDIEDENETE